MSWAWLYFSIYFIFYFILLIQHSLHSAYTVFGRTTQCALSAIWAEWYVNAIILIWFRITIQSRVHYVSHLLLFVALLTFSGTTQTVQTVKRTKARLYRNHYTQIGCVHMTCRMNTFEIFSICVFGPIVQCSFLCFWCVCFRYIRNVIRD